MGIVSLFLDKKEVRDVWGEEFGSMSLCRSLFECLPMQSENL